MARQNARNRQCPYNGHCHDVCYGESPCEFAVKFDKMQRKINRLKEAKAALVQENEALKQRLEETLQHKL